MSSSSPSTTTSTTASTSTPTSTSTSSRHAHRSPKNNKFKSPSASSTSTSASISFPPIPQAEIKLLKQTFASLLHIQHPYIDVDIWISSITHHTYIDPFNTTHHIDVLLYRHELCEQHGAIMIIRINDERCEQIIYGMSCMLPIPAYDGQIPIFPTHDHYIIQPRMVGRTVQLYKYVYQGQEYITCKPARHVTFDTRIISTVISNIISCIGSLTITSTSPAWFKQFSSSSHIQSITVEMCGRDCYDYTPVTYTMGCAIQVMYMCDIHGHVIPWKENEQKQVQVQEDNMGNSQGTFGGLMHCNGMIDREHVSYTTMCLSVMIVALLVCYSAHSITPACLCY